MRRSSYASVLSGTANAPTTSTPRSGFLSHLTDSATPTTASQSTPHQAQSSHPVTGTQAQTPPNPHAFSSVIVNDSSDSLPVTPSYLFGSKYLDLLADAYTQKHNAEQRSRSGRSSNAGTLSASASTMNLHRMVPSNRGMTHEIVEESRHSPRQIVAPLPTRFNEQDKYHGMEVNSDGLEVRYTGTIKSSDEGPMIRTDHSIPRQCGVYYYEVEVLSRGRENQIAVGFASPKAPLHRFPGWEPESWAYHGDDGFAYNQTASGRRYGPTFGQGDVVGVFVDLVHGDGFYTKNGFQIGWFVRNYNIWNGRIFNWLPGTAFRVHRNLMLHPAVGMKKPGECIRANFGQKPFVFDIDKHCKARQRISYEWAPRSNFPQILFAETREEITIGRSKGQSPERDENADHQELLAQYFSHDGYIETAKAFSAEVQKRAKLLHGGESSGQQELEYEEDLDAINRQQIRSAILDGDVDKALKSTTAHYPSVIQHNKDVYFKLRCRKFIEMIRKCTESQHSSPNSKPKPATNGHSGPAVADSDPSDNGMDMEDEPGDEAAVVVDNDGMEIEESDQSIARLPDRQLMNEAIEYGQELRAEFKDDPRMEVKQSLEETFALIAYPNAAESSLAPLLETDGRVPLAEELNSAILVSLGKSPNAVLDRMVQQTEVFLDDMRNSGRKAMGCFINVQRDYLDGFQTAEGPMPTPRPMPGSLF